MKRDGRTPTTALRLVSQQIFIAAASACRWQSAPRHYHRAVYN